MRWLKAAGVPVPHFLSTSATPVPPAASPAQHMIADKAEMDFVRTAKGLACLKAVAPSLVSLAAAACRQDVAERQDCRGLHQPGNAGRLSLAGSVAVQLLSARPSLGAGNVPSVDTSLALPWAKRTQQALSKLPLLLAGPDHQSTLERACT